MDEPITIKYEDIQPGDLLDTPLYNSVIIGVKTPNLFRKEGFEWMDSWEAAEGILTYKRSLIKQPERFGDFMRLNRCKWRPGEYKPREQCVEISRELLEYALRDVQNPVALEIPNNAWMRFLDLDEVKQAIDALL